MKLSQILSHPFMTVQSHPQESRLRHSSGRPFIPSTLGSLDSGHATMSSSNHTLSHHGSSSGPLRATHRPKGLPPHPAPPLQCQRSDEGSNRGNVRSSSTSHSHPEQHQQIGEKHDNFLYRRANSLGSLTGQDSNGRQDDAWSYHSQPVERKSYSGREKDKENPSVPKVELVVGEGQGARRPFQDRTNRQTLDLTSAPSKPKLPSTVGSRPASRVEQQSVGSLRDLVPPLDAARLHPTQHETRSEVVSVNLAVSAPSFTSIAPMIALHHQRHQVVL